MTETIRLLELEHRLAADTNGEYRDQLCGEFNDELFRTKQLMDRGLPGDEFQRAEKYHAALTKAIEMVNRVWKVEHRQL